MDKGVCVFLSFCKCIVLIIHFCLISNTGVNLSLFEKCHHGLICDVIDFKVPLPPPYLRILGL